METPSETGEGLSEAQTELPTPAQLREMFPDYDVRGLIGQGGMGAVYFAHQRKLGRDVALKILKPGLESDPSFAERFEREARTLARLSHPGIVTVHDFGRAGDDYYIVMEYVDGLSLREWIDTERLSSTDVLELVPQLCDALQYAHDHGVVHRDIKPANILVDHQGRIRIADFGLAKLVDDRDSIGLTATHQAFGTPHYMAPEQMQGAALVDHRADLYSLGVVLYEMLTGELPIGRFDPPSAKSTDSVNLDAVVLRSLESEPDKRYQQAREIKGDLKHPARPAPETESDPGEARAEPGQDSSRKAEGSPSPRRVRAWVLTSVIFLAHFMVWVHLPYSAFGDTQITSPVPFGKITIVGWQAILGFGPLSLPGWFLLVCALALTLCITLEESGRSIPARAIFLILLAGSLLSCLPFVSLFGGGYPGLGSLIIFGCFLYWSFKEPDGG